MKVLVFVVNYRADDYLLRLIASLQTAMAQCPEVKLRLHVHDNSEKNIDEQRRQIEAMAEVACWVDVHFSPKNTGYFGSLGLAQALAGPDTDCVIYCNPDLTLAPDFFSVLATIAGGSAGVLAPSIISESDGFDQNPKYILRPTRRKLARLRLIYSNAGTFWMFHVLTLLKERLARDRTPPSRSAMPIFAAHGSVMLFTDVGFFKSLPPFPCFLFGEELFVAEEAKRRGVPTYYEPRLRVHDVRHASIRLLPKRARREMLHESIRFLLGTYYR